MNQAVFSIFRQYMYNNLRDKISLFWHIFFPMILLTVLILIFSGLEESNIEFSVAFLNQEISSFQGPVNIPDTFLQVFKEESMKDNSWIMLTTPNYDDDAQLFYSSQLEALMARQRHAFIVIPDGFNERVYARIGEELIGTGSMVPKAQVHVYYRSHYLPSEILSSILERMVEEMNREIALEIGLLHRDDLILSSMNMVENLARSSFTYHDYIIPGVILMSFLMTGLYLCFESLLIYRDKGILRRYQVTPLSTKEYFSGLILWVFLLSIGQIIFVYAMGFFFFKANLALLTPSVILYYLFALLVVISFGFFVASLASNADSGSAIANFLLYPMMFLGGLFFPVENVPLFLQVIIWMNPVTYLINGLRDLLGVYPSFTPTLLNYLVPLFWVCFTLFFSVKRFTWEAS